MDLPGGNLKDNGGVKERKKSGGWKISRVLYFKPTRVPSLDDDVVRAASYGEPQHRLGGCGLTFRDCPEPRTVNSCLDELL